MEVGFSEDLIHSISRVGVTILFVIEFNYSRLIQHEMLKKPVTYIIILL